MTYGWTTEINFHHCLGSIANTFLPLLPFSLYSFLHDKFNGWRKIKVMNKAISIFNLICQIRNLQQFFKFPRSFQIIPDKYFFPAVQSTCASPAVVSRSSAELFRNISCKRLHSRWGSAKGQNLGATYNSFKRARVLPNGSRRKRRVRPNQSGRTSYLLLQNDVDVLLLDESTKVSVWLSNMWN